MIGFDPLVDVGEPFGHAGAIARYANEDQFPMDFELDLQKSEF